MQGRPMVDRDDWDAVSHAISSRYRIGILRRLCERLATLRLHSCYTDTAITRVSGVPKEFVDGPGGPWRPSQPEQLL